MGAVLTASAEINPNKHEAEEEESIDMLLYELLQAKTLRVTPVLLFEEDWSCSREDPEGHCKGEHQWKWVSISSFAFMVFLKVILLMNLSCGSYIVNISITGPVITVMVLLNFNKINDGLEVFLYI